MTLRNLVLLGSLAMVLGGCVVAPRPYAAHAYYSDRDDYYDNDYYDYYDTPSYEGYYYVRIIFLGNAPYYVDDDRHIRPLPPRVYNQFLRSPYRNSGGRLPVFSRDSEVRDGYPMSRIVYFNNVPYYVENNRSARPLPNNLQERFRYSPLKPNFPMNGNHGPSMRDEFLRKPQPPYGREPGGPQPYDRDRERNQPPAYGEGRDRMEQPAYGRDRKEPQPFLRDREREGNQPPAYGQNRDQVEQPVYGRGGMDPQPFPREREQNNGGNDGSSFNGRMLPPTDRNGSQRMPMRQEQPLPQPDQRSFDDSRAPVGGGRMRDEERPQPNGGNNRPAPNRKQPRGDQEDSDGNGRGNGNGNRRD